MLETFPKAISQAATSHEYFPKWQVPKCPILQVGISQVCPSRSACPPSMFQPQRSPPPLCSLTYPLRSGRLGNCTIQKLPLGNFSLGKSLLGKCHQDRFRNAISKIYFLPLCQKRAYIGFNLRGGGSSKGRITFLGEALSPPL